MAVKNATTWSITIDNIKPATTPNPSAIKKIPHLRMAYFEHSPLKIPASKPFSISAREAYKKGKATKLLGYKKTPDTQLKKHKPAGKHHKQITNYNCNKKKMKILFHLLVYIL